MQKAFTHFISLTFHQKLNKNEINNWIGNQIKGASVFENSYHYAQHLLSFSCFIYHVLLIKRLKKKENFENKAKGVVNIYLCSEIGLHSKLTEGKDSCLPLF